MELALAHLDDLVDVVTEEELLKLNTEKIAYSHSNVYRGRLKITKTMHYRVDSEKELMIMFMIFLVKGQVTVETTLHMTVRGGIFNDLDRILLQGFEKEVLAFQRFFEQKSSDIQKHANRLLEPFSTYRLFTLFDDAIAIESYIPTLYKKIEKFSTHPSPESVKEHYRNLYGELVKDVL